MSMSLLYRAKQFRKFARRIQDNRWHLKCATPSTRKNIKQFIANTEKILIFVYLTVLTVAVTYTPIPFHMEYKETAHLYMIIIGNMNLADFYSVILVYVNAAILYLVGYHIAAYTAFIIYFTTSFQIQLMLLVDNISRIGERGQHSSQIYDEQYQTQVYYDICRSSKHHNQIVKLVY